jgi:hypothetical protein
VVKQACQRAAFCGNFSFERMKKLKKAAGSQKAPVGSKKRTSAKRELSVTLAAVVSFLAITFVLGYNLGKDRSPDWNDTGIVKRFMRENCKPQFLPAARQSLPDSEPIIELRLAVEDRQFIYRTDTKRIDSTPVPDWDRYARQPKDYGDSVKQAAFWVAGAGGLFGGHVPLGPWLLKSSKGTVFLSGAAVIGFSGVFGFYLGYRKDPNYHSDRFRELLKEPMTWQEIADEHRHAATSRAPSRAAPSATP